MSQFDYNKDARNLSDRELLLQVNYKVNEYEKKFTSLEQKLGLLNENHIRLEVQTKTRATIWGTLAALLTSIVATIIAALSSKG